MIIIIISIIITAQPTRSIQGQDTPRSEITTLGDATAQKDTTTTAPDVTDAAAAPDTAATLPVTARAIDDRHKVVIVTATAGILTVGATAAAAAMTVGPEVKAEVARLGLVAFYWL